MSYKHTMDDTTGFEAPKPKIIVHGVWPPIPSRAFDYCAYYDGHEPDHNGDMVLGWGKTEAEAIADLLDNYPL